MCFRKRRLASESSSAPVSSSSAAPMMVVMAGGKDNAAQYAQGALPLSKLEEWSRVTEGRDD